jgi:protein-S-isoprenylcysteine O-methyltransferase Ste14
VNTKKTFLRSAIVLYFIIAFEVLIMISPFAGFFYSIFNPVLLKVAAYPSTRWLSAFFLPHMVLPPGWFLQAVRVKGSVLFVMGLVLFFICAGQIYVAKFWKKGAVLSGLYAYIRHPQYLALGLAGLGLAILWPRFMTVALWLAMTVAYYLLAKDEERRMLAAHGDTYLPYMNRTGMFLPKWIENALIPASLPGKVAFGLVFWAVVLGGAFFLRAFTIDHLTLWQGTPNVTGLAILPEDGAMMDHRLGDILGLPEVRERLEKSRHYLVYFLPQNYIMQGMIADTGGDWKLYKQHHTAAMITDWVFHPFRHLQGGHTMMHAGLRHDAGAAGDGMTRRLIFLSIEGVDAQTPAALFGINALRVPQFLVDVEVHELHLLEVRELPHGSGWGSVPTPTF